MGAQRKWLVSVDGVRLSAVHLWGGQRAGVRRAVVLAHGFTGSWRSAAMQRVMAGLAPYLDVVAVDLRGHGSSGGATTAGDTEVLDLDAAVRWAHELGYGWVASCGFSLGGAVAIRHGALFGGVDAVVSVSAPSRWHLKNTVPMRRVHFVLERPVGRRLARMALRTRIDGNGWPVDPVSPCEAVGAIAPTPLLLVHGDRDRYFALEQVLALAERARPPYLVWVVPGLGHAEGAVPAELVEAIGRHLVALDEPPGGPGATQEADGESD